MYKFVLLLVSLVNADPLADSIADCQNRIVPAQEQWKEDCLEKCSHYATTGLPWCPGAETSGQVLLECIESMHSGQCSIRAIEGTEVGAMDNVEHCQTTVGNPTNEVFDKDCKTHCEWYHTNGEAWCPGVASDREELVECVLRYQPHCVKV